MRMDSSTEEEQEEFFESLEVIPASPSSESESGGDDNCRRPTAMAKASVESHQVLLSRYEVWQNDTSSILERRQRLFSQMGIRLEREDSKRVPVFPERIEQRSLAESNGNQVKYGRHNAELLDTVEGLWDHQSPVGNKYSVLHETANDTHGISSDRSHASSSRLGKSSTAYPPEQSCRGSEMGIVENFSLLRSVSSGQSMSVSGFGNVSKVGKTSDIARSSSVQEGAFCSWSKVGMCDPPVNFAGVLVEECTVSVPQEMGQDGELASNESAVLHNPQDAELLCRIKDLDSGKEFVVNTGGKDGSRNKVKELSTGRELTLEEFDSSLGFSPIVQEVMKRERASDDNSATIDVQAGIDRGAEKKKRVWFKAIKGFVNGSRDKGHHNTGNSGRVGSLEKSGRRSSSESNDSHESPPQLAKRIKVHVHKKSTKDFADLYLRQEIQAHEGAIWTMKFNCDGSFLASAGQDKVVRVWEVLDHDRGVQSPPNKTGNSFMIAETKGVDNSNHVKGCIKEGLTANNSPHCTNKPFLLSEKPKHSFFGHNEDVLDLSWSHSQFLLSSSMDKTVRLWNVMSGECSRIFAHSDYVTCIQFNPVDAGYFISGSLDGKVRIWSIKDRQVVDWVDLCEMVTAACYMPNGQGAAIGSYKGTCHFYKISDSKLQFDTKFEVQRKRKKRSQGKKITGFQFIPGKEDKILITSSDSRIRVYDGQTVCSKYIGLRNSNSQIAASFSSNGTYVICASEDSRVCIWKYYDSSMHSIQKQKSLSRSYEDFFAQRVSIAIPWPGSAGQKLVQEKSEAMSLERSTGTTLISISADSRSALEIGKSHAECAGNGELAHEDLEEHPCPEATRVLSQHSESNSSLTNRATRLSMATSPMLDSYLEDCCSVLGKVRQDEQNASHTSSVEGGGSATWLEYGLPSIILERNSSQETNAKPSTVEDVADKKVSAIATAWGLVIVTAGLGGEIQVFQNLSLPV